jgi:CheY-like chemotaxis protein
MALLKDQISPFSQGLTVLLVDDDPVSLHVVAARLEGVFRQLILASDGREGMAAFRAHGPQIVLTDHRMPELSGIDMMEQIRKTDTRVLFVFITSTMDTALLVRAINLGVSAIIPKPVLAENLAKAIALAVGVLENDQLQRKNLEQELALLQFREKYHEYQQEVAFRKELSILENDYLYRVFAGSPGSGQGEWVTQVEYLPRDIMCGDSYSLRRLPDGSQLVFLADAMGKGLAASITTSLAAYAFNLEVDAVVAGKPFAFRAFVATYTALIRKRLLEDEVFSFCLAWLPVTGAFLETAAFGMPPILVGTPLAALRRLRCNNPPLSAFGETLNFTVHELGEARSILLYSDGLNEAVTGDASLYRDYLDADFGAALGSRQLWEAFKARVAVPDDDVTCVLLSRVDGKPRWQDHRVVPSSMGEVERACLELEEHLETQTSLGPGGRTEFGIAMREALLNAFEHGSLGITTRAKQRLLEEGGYYDHLLATEAIPERPITVTLSVHPDGGNELVKLTVRDEGPGFTPPAAWFNESDHMLLCGRGLRMVRKYTDAFYFNDKGNVITLLKIHARGQHAD